MTAPPLITWLLAFALFLAQAGAASHALEHLHDHDAPQAEHCALCLAYAGVLGAAPAAGALEAIFAARVWSPRVYPPAQPCQREVLACIRAPPACSWPT